MTATNIKRDFAYAPLVAILNLPKSEEKVWITLFTFQGMNDYCFPSQEAIKRRMGNCMSVSRISRIITQLQKKGWVEKWRKGRRNQYRVCVPSDILFQPDFTSLNDTSSSNNSYRKSKVETLPAKKKEVLPQAKEEKKSHIVSREIDEHNDRKYIDMYSREWVRYGRSLGMTPEFYHEFCEYHEVSDYLEYIRVYSEKFKKNDSSKVTQEAKNYDYQVA